MRLSGSFAQVLVVDAHPPLSASLLHKDHVGEPLGVIDFRDKFGLYSHSTLSLSLAVYAFLRDWWRLFRLTGLDSGLTFSLWQTTLGSIPDISLGEHVNRSVLSRRHSMRSFSTVGGRLAPILTFLAGLSSIWTDLNSSSREGRSKGSFASKGKGIFFPFSPLGHFYSWLASKSALLHLGTRRHKFSSAPSTIDTDCGVGSFPQDLWHLAAAFKST